MGDGAVGVWRLLFVVCVPGGRQQSSCCEEGQYRQYVYTVQIRWFEAARDDSAAIVLGRVQLARV